MTRKTSQLTVARVLLSSAIALTLSSSISGISEAHAQSDPQSAPQSDRQSDIQSDIQSEPAASLPVTEQQTETASPSREEKITRLEAAVLTVENNASEYTTREKIDMLRQMAVAYSTLDEQARAVELLEKAVQLAQESDSDRRPTSPFRVASTYIGIGENDAAERLLTPETEISSRAHINQLIEIAEAYIATENSQRAAGNLALAIDALGKPNDWESGSSFVYYIGRIAENYGQMSGHSSQSAAAQAGLQRLMTLAEEATDAYGPDTYNKNFATTLSQLAIAQSRHGNIEALPSLLEQAMARIQDGEQTGYIIADVARAYGYAEDKAAAEQALAEIQQLATNNLASVDPIGPVSALSAVAIAQAQLGNPSQSAEALEIISENFGDSLYMLGALLSIHTQMENSPAQEAVIQQMFDKLPELRNAGLVVSDVTAGYSGISGLVEAYGQTTNDKQATERLALLESFFKEVEFDPLGQAGQLAIIAAAAAQREDYAAAQRLLTEATQALAVNNNLSEAEQVNTISRLTYCYGLLVDDGAKQAGLDTLQQIANNSLAPALNSKVTGAITRARAAL